MDETTSLSVVVAEFNELTRQGEAFDGLLCGLIELSERLEVFLVDDASTDGSWERIQQLCGGERGRIHTLRLTPNGQKVKAIAMAVGMCRSDYVMLMDFDSKVIDPESIPKILGRFEGEERLGGVCLKLIPEGKSILYRFQDIEYAVAGKIFNSYTSSQRKLRCIPGAAGIWRRGVLLEVLAEHSGSHDGDDLETTVIAQRKGHVVEYLPLVAVKTSVPQNPRELFRQRKRWELGALKTFSKEKRFYLSQVADPKNRLGHVTLLDWYGWATMVLSPVFLVNSFLHPAIFVAYFLIEVSLETTMVCYCRGELQNPDHLVLLPLLPIYRYFAMAPRVVALFAYLTRYRSGGHPRNRASNVPTPIPGTMPFNS